MKHAVSAAFCCIALLISCQQTEEIVNPSEELTMSIEASIGDSDAVSGRYAGNSPNDVEFTDEDAIGLSVKGGDFIKWTYNGSQWQRADGKTAYWDEKGEEHTFNAFYPFNTITSEGFITMPSLKIQDGTMNSVSECDFLIAKEKEFYSTSNGTVSLTFNHVSSLVTIRLKGEGDLVNATINQITISGKNILSSSTYSFNEENHVVVEDENSNTMNLELKNCVITEGQNQEFYFIFNSGTVNLSEVTLVIGYNSNNTEYTATLQGLGSNQERFISGEQHIFSLKIADGVLSVSGNTIADWNGNEPWEDIIINGIENNINENN